MAISTELDPTPQPDPRQALALEHPAGPMLVTGAPGTGKTWVLRERLARLVETGADPERVALVVSSWRARREARDALLGRVRGSLPGLKVMTAHGLAHHVVGQRYRSLGYDRPPQVLTAAEQFSRVRELLSGEDPARWPAYGGMLRLRGFADEVRQFLLRAQEALLTPDDILAKAEAMGLTGWRDLASFYRRYLQVLDDQVVVDFAGLLEQAAAAATRGGEEPPPFDHLLVDDYQDATFAAEGLFVGLGAKSLVVAGDIGSHIFSFQGTTDEPLRRFPGLLPGAPEVLLEADHRAGGARVMDAWCAPHSSEEHAMVARELRRIHVEDGVSWRDLAVVVRRQGARLGGLLRALDDAGVPRSMPERGLSLLIEPATYPMILALRWLARPAGRDGLVESLLTSDLARLSPASARGLVRAARAAGQAAAAALEHQDGLAPDEQEAVATLRRVLSEAEAAAGKSVLDAFAALWRGLPSSRRLVDAGERVQEARRDLDAVAALAEAVAGVDGGGDGSVAAFLDLLEAGDAGPGFAGLAAEEAAEAVRVHTAHGTAGQQFDTVIVVDTVEGDFPSLSRPEPMFDLRALERPVSQSDRNRARLDDERRLFRMVAGRARRRVLFTASDPRGQETTLSVRSRFVGEAGVAWAPAPAGPYPQPLTVGEATASWRRQLGDRGLASVARLAALDGILALGVDPARWWFQRDWTGVEGPLHEDLHVSYSRLERLDNCALQYVLSQELGLEGGSGYHAWVGHLVHRLIEDCENGAIPRSQEALVAEAQARWRQDAFPSFAVSEAFRRMVTAAMLPAWFSEFGAAPALARELRFRFEFDGAMVTGVIDRVGACQNGGTQITDYKTGKSRNAGKAADNLQLGIYYLAVNRAEELADYRPVRAVELAFVRDLDRDGRIARSPLAFVGDGEEAFEGAMAERLSGLIGRLRELQVTENYRPSTKANCRFCDFKPLCPLWPEGKELFPAPVAEVAAP